MGRFDLAPARPVVRLVVVPWVFFPLAMLSFVFSLGSAMVLPFPAVIRGPARHEIGAEGGPGTSRRERVVELPPPGDGFSSHSATSQAAKQAVKN